MLHTFVADPLPRPVCDARSDGSEAGLQRPFAPTERAPLRFGPHVLSTDQEDIGHKPITMAAARGDGEDESDITRVNLLMARNADRRGKTARTQCLTERRAHAIAGVGEDRPEANAGSFRNWTNSAGPRPDRQGELLEAPQRR